MENNSSVAVAVNAVEMVNLKSKLATDSIRFTVASTATIRSLESVVDNGNTPKTGNCEPQLVPKASQTTESCSPSLTVSVSTTAATVSTTPTTTTPVNAVIPPVENRRNNDLNLSVFFGVMRNESERLLTFTEGNWPISFISIQSLANAGFFYLCNSDRVQCAFCKGVICSWEPDDVPLNEHKRHYPRCPFIMGYEVGNNPIDKDPIRGVKRQMGRSVCGGFHRHTTSVPRQEKVLQPYTVPPKQVNLEEFGVLVQKVAKNSKYASRLCRIISFSAKWPKDVKYKAREIADAGFYFCGVDDCVKCFYCDAGVYDWTTRKDPWTEHAIRSPYCDYLILNKGRPFIKAAMKCYEDEVLKIRDAELAEKAVNEWVESDVVKDLLSIHDYPKDALRAVLQKRWETTKVNYQHLGELNSAIVSFIITNSKNEQMNVEHVSSSQKSIESQSLDSLSSLESCESLSQTSTSPLSSSPPSSLSPIPSIDKERLLCKMCLDREIGVVFLPCGHMGCTQCAPGVTSCPVCRAVIKGTVRMFLA